MKKFLSLVLALIMTMSLVTISAGAKDFTDDSKLNYKEAVDVISALKVVDGYADGSFNPQATLTRGAAAKIICNLILGPTTASALVADAAPFKDVPADSTFAGYIAFCSKEGIISGYADGTFKPGNSLTGYAFMKMLLGALGYDKSVEGYDGANWSINVAKRALNIGLDDGLVADFDGIKPVTREEACLYAFNTLTADMVEYKNKSSIVVGDITVTTSAEASKITLNDTKDYRESIRNTAKVDGYQQFCEAYFTNLKLKDISGTVDAFGRPANTWYNKTDKIGTYPKDADLTYYKNVKGKDIFKDLEMDKNDAYTFDLVVDGKEYTDVIYVSKTSTDALNSFDTVGKGSLVEVFEDDQIITVQNTYLLKVVGDYDEKDEELDLDTITDGLGTPLTRTPVTSTKLSSDDFAGLDEFKDGDIVAVTFAYNDSTAKYDIKSIAAAESVTAVVTEYVDNDSVTFDGEARGYNVTAAAADNRANYQYSVKDEATLYLDAQGNVLWAKGVEAKDNYVYIVDFSAHTTSTTRGDIEAFGYFLDGTDDSFTLNKVNNTKYAGTSGATTLSTAPFGEGWYRYTEKDTGKYDLTRVAAPAEQALTARIVSGQSIITDYASQKTDLGNGAYYGNKATKFIIVDKDGDVSVYEGIKNAPKTVLAGAGNKAVAVIDSGTSYAKYVYINVGATGTVKGGSTSGDKIYILKADGTYGTDTDGDTYYRYKAIVNGEEKKIKIDGTTDYTYGLYTSVEYNTKGYVVDMDPVVTDDNFSADAVAGLTVTKYKNNTIVLSNGINYYLADDCVITLITSKDTVEKVTANKLAKDYATTAFSAGSTIHGVLNADDEFVALYVNVR